MTKLTIPNLEIIKLISSKIINGSIFLSIINSTVYVNGIDSNLTFEKFYKFWKVEEISGDFRYFIRHDNITKLLPVKKVGGSFMCSNNNLTTLEGAPQWVGKNFYCSSNNLTTLEGAPRRVGGNFYCDKNTNLTTLKGAPQWVGGSFSCSNNNLTTLKEIQKITSNVKGQIISDFGTFKGTATSKNLNETKIAPTVNKLLTDFLTELKLLEPTIKYTIYKHHHNGFANKTTYYIKTSYPIFYIFCFTQKPSIDSDIGRTELYFKEDLDDIAIPLGNDPKKAAVDFYTDFYNYR